MTPAAVSSTSIFTDRLIITSPWPRASLYRVRVLRYNHRPIHGKWSPGFFRIPAALTVPKRLRQRMAKVDHQKRPCKPGTVTIFQRSQTISTNDASEAHCDELAFRGRPLFGHATTAGFHFSHSVCFAAMFEPIREKIETAAQKITQLRRFL